jgi:hypothetical protein
MFTKLRIAMSQFFPCICWVFYRELFLKVEVFAQPPGRICRNAEIFAGYAHPRGNSRRDRFT